MPIEYDPYNMAHIIWATRRDLRKKSFQVIRAQWIDPIVSHDVEKILGSVENLDVWVPETLDMIHETRSIDFMISPHQHDNISQLLRMNTVQSKLISLI